MRIVEVGDDTTLPGTGAPALPLAAGRPHTRRWLPLAFVAILLVLWFGFLELRGLYFPDEGRYAEIPREMLASGDWVTPRLNGFPYFEKPPLHYWITAAIFAVAGEDEWTARLWTAFAGLGGILAVLLTARRLYSKRAGWMAAAIMASSIGYFLASQFVTLDMGLTALLTCALCAFVLAQDARTMPADRRRWMLIAWSAAALAVLVKGPVGVAIPALAVATYVAVQRDMQLLRRLHIGAGLGVAAIIVVPWFALVELRNPGFAEFFFLRENWQRFMQPLHNRTGPWWYFIPIAAGILLPWLPAIVASLRWPKTLRPADAPRTFDTPRFLWCWAGAIFVFFSLSSSKLPAYIMPAVGAVALAVAPALAGRWYATLRHTARTSIVTGALIATCALPAAAWIKIPMLRDAFVANVAWLIGGGIVLALGGVATYRLLHARRPLRALAVTVLGTLLACQLGVVVAYRIDAYFSAERLVESVVESIVGDERWFQSRVSFRREIPFYSVGMFDHTVPFYLGRTLIVVQERGELAPGIAAESANFIPEVTTFANAWRMHDDAYAIMPPELYDKLRQQQLPMRWLGEDGRRVIVSRR